MRSESEPTVPIEVCVGETFAISLEAIPTTGYTWESEHDAKMVALVDNSFKPHSAAIGAGGKEIFKFKAKQPGETQITLKYKREWEMTSRETKIFQVQIK